MSTTTTRSRATPDLTRIPEPRALTEFPEYARLAGRLDALRAQRGKLADRAARIERDLASGRRLDQAVAALLAGGDAGMAAGADPESLRAEHSRLQGEVRVHDAALEQGERDLARLRARHAPEALRAVHNWHRALVQAMAHKAAELARLAALEVEAVQLMDAHGFSLGEVLPQGAGRPVVFVGLAPGQEDSPLSIWLGGLIEAGLLDAADGSIDGTGASAADLESQERARSAEVARFAQMDVQASAAAAERRRQAIESGEVVEIK
jgi:hypothetical protein